MTKSNTKKSAVLQVQGKRGMSEDRAIAEVATSAPATAASVSVAYSTWFGDVSLTETMSVLTEKVKRVQDGNLCEAEAMLMAQAAALNSIFAELGRRAAPREGQTFDAMERYLRLALKAQAQCRATLETLSVIKNPPVVIARQANIANGPQQVNNGVAAPAHVSRAENPEPEQNKLLEEAGHVERLDSGAASSAAGSDSSLAPVGKVDGTTNPKR